jgi:hypothetical protein
MSTHTEQLADLTLEVDPAATTVRQLLARVAQAQGWPPADSLLRLEGALFRAPRLPWLPLRGAPACRPPRQSAPQNNTTQPFFFDVFF